MSATEAAPAAPDSSEPSVRRSRTVSSRFLRSELRLIFSRRRNLAGLLVLAAVPVLLSVATKLSSSGEESGGDFFSSITDNGLFVALASLTIELGLFLPLGIAVISGDSLAGEANTGTLRYLLTVPVHRTRLLVVKYLAIVLFSLVETFTVTVTGLLMGLALFGGGPMTLLSGSQVSFGDGLLRVLLASVYLGLCFASLGAVGLFVSTLTEQPVGAMIAVVIFSTASFILDTIPQVSWLHPFLITHHWLAFGDLFRDPVAWQGITQGLYVVAAYVVVFWLAAWARFTAKDITS
jgi:ABC-2 type transport system permease protein